MEEVLDRFLIRIIFAIFVCLILFLYRYLHFVIYPKGVKQISTPFNLMSNLPNSLHYLSRILGMVILFSFVEFNRFFTLEMSLIHLFLLAIVLMISYLISIHLMEMIVLYKFNYKDEILKNQNLSYSLIIFSLNISVAFLLKTVMLKSNDSLIIFITLWLYVMTLLGLAGKLFIYYSKFQFNRAISQKNFGVAFSFLFYILGNTYILVKAFDQPQIEKYSYMLRIFFKCFSSCLFIPFFIFFIKFIFSLRIKKNELNQLLIDPNKSVNFGVAEGLIFLISAYITSWIVYNINLSGLFSIL